MDSILLVGPVTAAQTKKNTRSFSHTNRVKTLLAKLDTARRTKELGYEVGTQARLTSHKFMGSVEKIFKNLPKPLEW
jgi:hypothetical protein